MKLPEQRIRVVAADPIELGDRRLLPSVLVNTMSRRWDRGLFRSVRLRPASVVVETADGATWHEIPNTTANTLSSMAAAAATIALISIAIIGVSRFLRRS